MIYFGLFIGCKMFIDFQGVGSDEVALSDGKQSMASHRVAKAVAV